MKTLLIRVLLILPVLGIFPNAILRAVEPRTALVMGVWQYSDPKFPSLPGIESDLKKMTAKLKELGFDVTTVANPTLGRAKDAVDEFGSKLLTVKGVGLFYFSGHGSENEGKNYLIPKGSHIKTRGDLTDEALSAQRVLTRMEEAKTNVNLVFLDCCRNVLNKGEGDLAPMKATGTFIGFATADAKTAGAGDEGSPYTIALLENLGSPGLELTVMHTKVTRRVKELSGGDQIPFQYSGLDNVFYMVPSAGSGYSQNSAAENQTMQENAKLRAKLAEMERKQQLNSLSITSAHPVALPSEKQKDVRPLSPDLPLNPNAAAEGLLKAAAVSYVNSGNSDKIDSEMFPYAEEVDYYGQGKMTKSHIRADLMLERKKWPSRHYQFVGVSKIEYNAGTDTGTIIVQFTFEVSNGEKRKTGQSETFLTFRSVSKDPKVILVTEQTKASP